MILCVSANPGLDRRIRLAKFNPGEVQRAHLVEPLPGGKAAHVAMATHALGVRTAWVGFLGGGIGLQVATELGHLGIEVVAVQTESSTRVNLEILEDSGRITELLEPGGQVRVSEQDALIETVAELLDTRCPGALVVVSGSLPPGVPPQFYASVIDTAKEAGSKVFLDTSGDALAAGLSAAPYFVKPNQFEAEALLGSSSEGADNPESAAKELIARGAESAAITLGASGLVWAEGAQGGVWFAEPPHVHAISTVGCGDATLAGFAYAELQGWTGERAIRFATACGSANCLAEKTGRISKDDVNRLLAEVKVKEVELSHPHA